ncbi:MAG: GNAT family N-acetyltransferase [Fulvivirga sp.]|nr:GNAT family N-acetyltransferase [Fulvivirga sp.]
MKYSILVANQSHFKYALVICEMMKDAAKVRGTGIAKRSPAYIRGKLNEGKAVIALDHDKAIGFCYIESWEGQKYVANSGLIVHPDYRNTGLARAIKKQTFLLSKKMFPQALLFGITTSMAVMKINASLGYEPVSFSALTKDEQFWKGCESCTNYDILQRTNKSMCLCTGMVCDLSKLSEKQVSKKLNGNAWEQFKLFLKNRQKRIQNQAKEFPILKKLVNHE